MVKNEVIEDLRTRLDNMVSDNTLKLCRSDYTKDEMREKHQEQLVEWLKIDGVYEYTDSLTDEEVDQDDDRSITAEYVKWLEENDL